MNRYIYTQYFTISRLQHTTFINQSVLVAVRTSTLYRQHCIAFSESLLPLHDLYWQSTQQTQPTTRSTRWITTREQSLVNAPSLGNIPNCISRTYKTQNIIISAYNLFYRISSIKAQAMNMLRYFLLCNNSCDNRMRDTIQHRNILGKHCRNDGESGLVCSSGRNASIFTLYSQTFPFCVCSVFHAGSLYYTVKASTIILPFYQISTNSILQQLE